MNHVRRYHLALCTLAVALAAALGLQTHAVRRVAPLNPLVMAMVDLERVLENLEERAHLDSELVRLSEEIDASLESRRQEINNLDREIELYEVGSDKRTQILQRQQLLTLEYRAFVDHGQLRLERQQSRGLRLLYMSIRSAAADLAGTNGWDLVSMNDSAIDFREGDGVNVVSQIANRRVLWTNPDLDVTDLIVEHMNARFDAMAVR